MTRNTLYGSTRCFDIDCANDDNISLGPKSLIETNISKNSFLRDDKSFRPKFPRNIEYGKQQRSNYKGPQNILTFNLELVTSIFKT